MEGGREWRKTRKFEEKLSLYKINITTLHKEVQKKKHEFVMINMGREFVIQVNIKVGLPRWVCFFIGASCSSLIGSGRTDIM